MSNLSPLTMHSLSHNLTPALWEKASRALVAKMITEYAYEKLLPVTLSTCGPDGLCLGRLELDSGESWSFQCWKRIFGQLDLVTESVKHFSADGRECPIDALRFALDTSKQFGTSDFDQAYLCREMTNTLIADVHLAHPSRPTAEALSQAPYAALEGEMTAHPWAVFSKGRMGFGYADTLRHAPETAAPQKLIWVAVHTQRLEFHTTADWDVASLLSHTISAEERAKHDSLLQEKGLSPKDYLPVPLHPWQWEKQVLPLFADDIAHQRVVLLGESADLFRPQQSIRTFLNSTDPSRFTLKTTLTILNTAVWRGLPAKRTRVAPAVTQWLKSLLEKDSFLNEKHRLILLGEVAGCHVPHPLYDAIPQAPYHFKETFAAIWRESLATKLERQERAQTFAALLHVDPLGVPLIKPLIQSSGLSPAAWVRQMCEVVLPPLLHFMVHYGVAFSPHGENAILVLKNNVPCRFALKDFADDVNIREQPTPATGAIPPEVTEVLLQQNDEVLSHFILTGLLVSHFRYLSALLARHLDLPEIHFWAEVRRVFLNYRNGGACEPDHFDRMGFLDPTFVHVGINRVRLLTHGYAERSERPEPAIVGELDNPLHLAKDFHVSE